MEKLSDKKFNTIEKSKLKAINGGSDTQQHCAELTSWVAGGDTSHEITSDNGTLISAWSTKGNTVSYTPQL